MTYLLFVGDQDYPRGGAWDFRAAFETVNEAKAALSYSVEWAHIAQFDGTTMIVLFKFECSHYGGTGAWRRL